MTFSIDPAMLDELATRTGAKINVTAPHNRADILDVHHDAHSWNDIDAHVVIAASERLYLELQASRELEQAAAVGKSIVSQKLDRAEPQDYGTVPTMADTEPDLWLPALQVLLHVLAHAASSPMIELPNGEMRGSSCLSIPFRSKTAKPFTATTGVNVGALKKAVIALTHLGFLDLFPAGQFKGATPFVRPTPKMIAWLRNEGLLVQRLH